MSIFSSLKAEIECEMCGRNARILTAFFCRVVIRSCLTLYDPGGGGFKSPPPPILCSHAFNFGAALLCVGDFSQKIV